MAPLSVMDMSLRIGAALVLGALVGLERERKHRPAGFRTMILISLGSCGFVLLGLESMAQLSAEMVKNLPPNAPAPGQAELSRVLQGLIGGIGFLGAGAVIQSKRAVRGVTTAAAVWVVAALGAACGMGMFTLAALLGVATLFTLVILEVFENRYFPEPDDDWSGEKKKANGNGNGAAHGPSDAGDGPARLRGEMNTP